MSAVGEIYYEGKDLSATSLTIIFCKYTTTTIL
jgi:hypothetical protein